MNIDKKWLNKHLRETLNEQYEIDKFLKTKAKEKGIKPGYHIIYTPPENGEQCILTSQPLGENLQQAKEGLDFWLTSIPKPFKNAPLTLESPPLSRKQRRYLRIQAALNFLCVTFPKCFVPRGSPEPIHALAVGLGKTLFAAVEDKLPKGVVLRDIKDALRVYCSLPKYNAARRKVGNPRINLEGEVVGKVTKEEVKLFFDDLKEKKKKHPQKYKDYPIKVPLPKRPKKKPSSQSIKTKPSENLNPDAYKARIPITSFKVTLPLKTELFPRNILPPPNIPGGKKMKVYWEIALPANDGLEGQNYQAMFLVKNYRKVLNTIDKYIAEGQSCLVLLQGQLVNGFLIQEAGLSVQPKAGKVDYSTLIPKEENLLGTYKAKISVPSLKVTLPLKTEQVPKNILPPRNTPGSSKIKIYWDIVLPATSERQEQVYQVAFGVKNYRKIWQTLDQHLANDRDCVTLLQGKVVNGFIIQNAGLTVQVVKKPKQMD